MNNNWTFVIQFHRGHRYFLNEHTRRISICDYSGDYPHLTDDGIKYIHIGSGSEVAYFEPEYGRVRMGELFKIPLVDPYTGEYSYAVAGMKEALWVASYFNLDLNERAEQIMRELHEELGKAFGKMDLTSD